MIIGKYQSGDLLLYYCCGRGHSILVIQNVVAYMYGCTRLPSILCLFIYLFFQLVEVEWWQSWSMPPSSSEIAGKKNIGSKMNWPIACFVKGAHWFDEI